RGRRRPAAMAGGSPVRGAAPIHGGGAVMVTAPARRNLAPSEGLWSTHITTQRREMVDMRRQGGRFVTAAAAVVVAALLGISAAWACTGQPLLHLATDQVGEVGSQAKVEVLANQAVAGPVTLRWNALDGPVLATADTAAGTPATLVATIPEAAPGVYYLVLDTSAGVARTAFEVTGSAGSASPAAGDWDARAAGREGALSSFRAGVALLVAGLVALSVLTLASLGRRRAPAAGRVN
ncbi:MAG: hypothetical protein ACRD0S_09085, partial [Acidimicrobiales bacterium]